MKKKKDVIVWDQFAKSINDDSEHSKNKDSIPTFTRNYETDERKNFFYILRKIKYFKPIMIAAFSALLIGSILGFIVLNVLTNLNGEPTDPTEETMKSQVAQNNEPKQSNVDQRQLFTLESMQGQVIQVGVFSSRDNADEWINRYEKAGFFPTLWERDEQYFLFAGLAETKDIAKEMVTKIKEQGFDAFVKEWQTKEFEIQLSEPEYEWLISFQEIWRDTLYSVSINDGITFANWEKLLDVTNQDSDKIREFKEELTHFLKTDIKEERLQEQKVLLEMWYQFETIFIDN